MKILLFNIADHLSPYSFFLSLSSGYLKSYFEKHSELKDSVKIDVAYEGIFNYILTQRPDVIGISVMSEYYDEAIELAKEIKRFVYTPEPVIIIGGYHITALPETLHPVFDYGITGEGEVTFMVLAQALYYKWGKEAIQNIEGIVYHNHGKTIINNRRTIIPNLDTIPFPYRGGLKGRYTNIITSRGCPYGCSFCSSTHFWGKTQRFHSFDYVMEEMTELVTKYGIQHITFWDDLFIGDIKRLSLISEAVSKDKIFKKVTFGASARASVIANHPEILDMFKKMKVLRVSLGFESGSDKMLKIIKGYGASVESNQKALNLLRKYPFFITGGFIIGSPEETVEDIQQTYDFVKKSKLHGGYAAVAIAYPGTKYWDFALEKGLVSKSMDWSKLKTISSYRNLKKDDFTLLSDIDKDEFISHGRKFEKYFSKAAVKAYFDLRRFNLRILSLLLRDPAAFLPELKRTILKYLFTRNV